MKLGLCSLALCFPLWSSLMAEPVGKIQGKVLDQAGNPIPFANVMVQGTNIGAAADANGNYVVLNVPVGARALVAAAVGYRKAAAADVTVAEGQPATHDFTLQEDVLGMQEVVVTGTITPRHKPESTVAISTLGPQELSQAAPRRTSELLGVVPVCTG